MWTRSEAAPANFGASASGSRSAERRLLKFGRKLFSAGVGPGLQNQRASRERPGWVRLPLASASLRPIFGDSVDDLLHVHTLSTRHAHFPPTACRRRQAGFTKRPPKLIRP